MGSQYILIIVSSLLIYSYLADIVAKRIKIPSALILLASGLGLQFAAKHFNLEVIDFNLLLPALGTIGLIMIVFEGALGLDYEPSKRELIIKALIAGSTILIFTSLMIAAAFHYFTDSPFGVCLLNAIPFSVISSAIAITSAANLLPLKKEFIIFESSFSDIVGIVFFNFMGQNGNIDGHSFIHLGVETAGIVLISFCSCLLLLYILGQIKNHVKYVLIISILILIYALGKLLHLPSLVLIFAFGLFLKNVDLIEIPKFKNIFMYPRYEADLHQLHQISAEGAFLIRTFFFVIFGYTINVVELTDMSVIQLGTIVLAITYLIRLFFLKVIKTPIFPELFMTPKGLISLLLFYSIPEYLKISPLEGGILLFTILGTNLMMSFGLLVTKNPNKYIHVEEINSPTL